MCADNPDGLPSVIIESCRIRLPEEESPDGFREIGIHAAQKVTMDAMGENHILAQLDQVGNRLEAGFSQLMENVAPQYIASYEGLCPQEEVKAASAAHCGSL